MNHEIKEYDTVAIKGTGIVGEVIDIYKTESGKVRYTVEYEADPWDMKTCDLDELCIVDENNGINHREGA